MAQISLEQAYTADGVAGNQQPSSSANQTLEVPSASHLVFAFPPEAQEKIVIRSMGI